MILHIPLAFSASESFSGGKIAPLQSAIKLPTLMKQQNAPIAVPYIYKGKYSSINLGVATDYTPLASP